MNAFWMEKNWRKVVLMLNIGIGGAVLVFSAIDIFGPRIDGIVTLLRTIEFFAIAGSGFALLNSKIIESLLLGKAIAHPFAKALVGNDLAGVKAHLRTAPQDANLQLSNGETALGVAARMGSIEIVRHLLASGADPKLSGVGQNALFEAVCSGQNDIYALIRTKVNDAQLAQICRETNISEAAIACYEGNNERVQKLVTRGTVNNLLFGELSALHFAVLGARSREVIMYLVEIGGEPNLLAHMSFNRDGIPTLVRQSFSPLSLAIVAKDVELADFFFSRNDDARHLNGEKTFMMLACELGLTKFVESKVGWYNWNLTDSAGRTAIDYAKQSGHQDLVARIQKALATPNQTPASASKASSSNGFAKTQKRAEVSPEDLNTKLSVSLDGMVGLDNVIENFAHDISTFLNTVPGESRGVVLWGDASVGKSELGQRLAGLKSEFQIPGLDLEDVEVRYIACCDGDIDIAKEAAEASPKSIVIFDEIDKLFNPKSGIVDEAAAKKLRTSIVTNFQHKPIYWIFMGTFHDLRGQQGLRQQDLVSLLGTELASRLDFADWRMPSWTLETLVKAADVHFDRDEKFITYDLDSMTFLAQQALDSGGGVRMLLQYHNSFKREASKRGSQIAVDAAMAESLLSKLNAA